MKPYKTVVKLSNPRGAVLVNEDYQPGGNLRRYEANEIGIGILYSDYSEEDFELIAGVPNMDYEKLVYKLKPEEEIGGLSDYRLFEVWKVKKGKWIKWEG